MSDQVRDLHSAIMNLPCNVPKGYAPGKADEAVYRIGHRDARHAAAELAASHAAEVEALRSALRNLVVMLPSDQGDAAGAALVNPGFIYIRWQDLREARAALKGDKP